MTRRNRRARTGPIGSEYGPEEVMPLSVDTPQPVLPPQPLPDAPTPQPRDAFEGGSVSPEPPTEGLPEPHDD